jgi:Mlc titration factor MtfA (ptsG expression regulator)
MKHLISSAFVQITFGLRQDDLEYFNKIHITPKPYSYRNSTQLFHGDVNPMTKTVNMTWPVVKKGFEINDDGMNLAIHEFAHCIILENARRNYLVRNLNEEELKSWKAYSLKLLEKIRKGNNGLYRDYAGSNLMELFATSLEYFFEKPFELFSYDPEHYKRLGRLLKQDPRNAKDPTILREK